ncbi:TcuA: flavoprotein used to oxidize tricarballylate to cis-aconitate (plasmid) [Klebsiella aerogenes]|nr:TcuA: flavoprotein used to oxidize tricarballylate to cis-aconitate [Klebsiella aerogenes]
MSAASGLPTTFSSAAPVLTRGVLLKFMIDAEPIIIGDPSQSHCVAIDARAPLYDGGICTRVDCVSLGVVVNRDAERFYDEGEDFWPKRYAIWGRLVAHQPGQIGYSIIDSKAVGQFMPPVFPGAQANTIRGTGPPIGAGWRTFGRRPSPATMPPVRQASSTIPVLITALPPA